MTIRNRIIGVDGITVTTGQTNLVIAAVRIPALAKVKGVRAVAVGAAAGNSVSVMQNPGVADSTGALSTTLIHDAALAVVAADTSISDPMTGQFSVAKGVWLYFKATTGGTGYTGLSVQVELDY